MKFNLKSFKANLSKHAVNSPLQSKKKNSTAHEYHEVLWS